MATMTKQQLPQTLLTSGWAKRLLVGSWAGQSAQQKGAVLIISLILLLVLTMVVLSANREVVVQEKATAAIRESNVVFQVAESALMEAESYIDKNLKTDGGLAIFDDAGTGGFYAEGKGPSNYLLADTWQDDITKEAEKVVIDGYSARYFIEDLGEMTVTGQDISLGLNNNYNQTTVPPTAHVFRVVVRAEGRDGVPVRMVSGYYSTDL